MKDPIVGFHKTSAESPAGKAVAALPYAQLPGSVASSRTILSAAQLD